MEKRGVPLGISAPALKGGLAVLAYYTKPSARVLQTLGYKLSSSTAQKSHKSRKYAEHGKGAYFVLKKQVNNRVAALFVGIKLKCENEAIADKAHVIGVFSVPEKMLFRFIEGTYEAVIQRLCIPVFILAERFCDLVCGFDSLYVVCVDGDVRLVANLPFSDINVIPVLKILRPFHNAPLIEIA
jgi:hypothetical protein